MRPMITAMDMFGCSMMRPQMTPMMRSIGSMPRLNSCITACFLAMNAHMYSIMPNFAISEGWILCPAITIQRLAPLTSSPNTSTASSRPTDSRKPSTLNLSIWR